MNGTTLTPEPRNASHNPYLVLPFAQRYGCNVYRLSCAGDQDFYVAARTADAARRKAHAERWARGLGQISTEIVFTNHSLLSPQA